MKEYKVLMIKTEQWRALEETLTWLLNTASREGWQFESLSSTAPKLLVVSRTFKDAEIEGILEEIRTIELPVGTTGGSIQEACRRTILRALKSRNLKEKE